MMKKESSVCLLLLLLLCIGVYGNDAAVNSDRDKDNTGHSLVESEARKWLDDADFIKKITQYMSSYAGSNIYNWLTYPWFGIQAGAILLIVVFTCVYLFIWMSGWIIGTLNPAGRRGDLDYHVQPGGELEQLTRQIFAAIEAANNRHYGTKRSLGSREVDSAEMSEWLDKDDRKWGSTLSFPSWTTTVSAASDWGSYISTTLFNVLTWLGKPYMSWIAAMSGIALYMVVIVVVALTHNVFPSGAVPSGKRKDDDNDLSSNEISDFTNIFRRLGTPAQVDDTIRTAQRVMKAIDLWSEIAHRSEKPIPTRRFLKK